MLRLMQLLTKTRSAFESQFYYFMRTEIEECFSCFLSQMLWHRFLSVLLLGALQVHQS